MYPSGETILCTVCIMWSHCMTQEVLMPVASPLFTHTQSRKQKHTLTHILCIVWCLSVPCASLRWRLSYVWEGGRWHTQGHTKYFTLISAAIPQGIPTPCWATINIHGGILFQKSDNHKCYFHDLVCLWWDSAEWWNVLLVGSLAGSEQWRRRQAQAPPWTAFQCRAAESEGQNWRPELCTLNMCCT